VVLPRLGRLGEAVDDHQVELGRRLHEAGLVTFVEDEESMRQAVRGELAAGPARESPAMAGAADLASDLRSVLQGFGVRPVLA
jgi:UDP-N-acetylglucosamine transferase subunit ALG13